PEAVPPAVLLLVADEPVDRGLQARIVPITEPDEGPDRVPRDAHLTDATAEVAPRAREPPEEQVRRLPDPRVLLREPEVREDEELPVRGDVLRPVQLERGGPLRHPVALGKLFREDLRCPPLPPDLLFRAEEGGIVLGPVQEIPQDPEADARVRVLRE